jgi:hypothetical protein
MGSVPSKTLTLMTYVSAALTSTGYKEKLIKATPVLEYYKTVAAR